MSPRRGRVEEGRTDPGAAPVAPDGELLDLGAVSPVRGRRRREIHGPDHDTLLERSEQDAAQRPPCLRCDLAREGCGEPESHVRLVRVEEKLRQLVRVPLDALGVELEDLHYCSIAASAVQRSSSTRALRT